MMTNRVFLDTSFSLAAAITNDVNHEKAKEISKTLETSRTKIITTQAIVLEIGNALARGKHHPAAGEIIKRLRKEPIISVISLSDELIDKPSNFLAPGPTKIWAWSIVSHSS
jgi:predicted nucleic acid-binding protein